MLRHSLQFKISVAVVITLILGFPPLIYFEYKQDEITLLENKKRAAEMMSEPLLYTLYKDMLDERADMVYHLMQGMKNMKGTKRVQIVRGNGIEAAFADDKTLLEVEEEYGELKPEWKTPRISVGAVNVAPGVSHPGFRDAFQKITSDRNRLEGIGYIENTQNDKLYTYLAPIIPRQKCSACHNIERTRGVLMISLSMDDVDSALRETEMRGLISGLSIIVLASLILLMTIRFLITKPIEATAKEMSSLLSEMAEGRGDLTHRLTVTSRDELGSIVHSFNDFLEGLRKTFKGVMKTSKEVIVTSQKLSDSSHRIISAAEIQLSSAEETSTSINEMGASINSVSESANHIMSSADNASASMLQMSSSVTSIAGSMVKLSESTTVTSSSISGVVASIKQVGDNINDLSHASELIINSMSRINMAIGEIEQRAVKQTSIAENMKNDATNKSMTSVNRMRDGMDKINTEISSAYTIINKLGESTDELTKILGVINHVTESTSLLSFNAAILAAQAGEQGKGFAVVADEINELAEQTSISTKEIRVILKAFKEGVVDAIASVEKGLKVAEEGIILSKAAQSSLEYIVQNSEQSVSMAKEVEKTTREQHAEANVISASIQNMGSMVDEIKKAIDEQKRRMSEILQAANIMDEIALMVRKSTDEHDKESNFISSLVIDVAQKISMVARAIDEQKAMAGHVIRAVEMIKKAVETNVRLAGSLDSAVEKLNKEASSLEEGISRFHV